MKMLAVIMQIWGAGNNLNSPRRNCVRHCLEHWRDEAITTRPQRTQRRRLRFVFLQNIYMLFIAKICLLRVLKRFGYKSKLLVPWPYFLSFTDHLMTTFSSNASTRHLKKPGWDLKIFFYSATLTVTLLFKEIQITSCTETQSNCVLSVSRLICIIWFRRPQDQQFHHAHC